MSKLLSSAELFFSLGVHKNQNRKQREEGVREREKRKTTQSTAGRHHKLQWSSSEGEEVLRQLQQLNSIPSEAHMIPQGSAFQSHCSLGQMAAEATQLAKQMPQARLHFAPFPL